MCHYRWLANTTVHHSKIIWIYSIGGKASIWMLTPHLVSTSTGRFELPEGQVCPFLSVSGTPGVGEHRVALWALFSAWWPADAVPNCASPSHTESHGHVSQSSFVLSVCASGTLPLLVLDTPVKEKGEWVKTRNDNRIMRKASINCYISFYIVKVKTP